MALQNFRLVKFESGDKKVRFNGKNKSSAITKILNRNYLKFQHDSTGGIDQYSNGNGSGILGQKLFQGLFKCRLNNC